MFKKTVLSNGIRVITEKIPYSKVVSLGVWFNIGSRDEHDLNSGSAHFVEHMLFKGTIKRSAREIARELDVLGGTANAFTTREHICLHATVVDSNIQALVDLFADILANSVFSDEEVEREKQVILQEIHMVEDVPEERIHDLFDALLWGSHPLGRTILGSPEIVAAMDSGKIQEYKQTYFTSDKIVIAAAGNLDHEDFSALWQRAFVRYLQNSHPSLQRIEPARLPPNQALYPKPLEQVHVILGTYGLSAIDEDRYAYLLLNILLGGNMSSRLFQEIRENRGLAYAVYSYISMYSDSGCLAIYLGVNRETVAECLALVAKEINHLQTEPVSETELANAKDFVRSGLFLSLENMETVMTRIAQNELYFGKYIPVEEVLNSIDRIGVNDIIRLSRRVFARQDLTIAGLGPIAELKTGSGHTDGV